MTPRAVLRRMLQEKKLVVAPGCYDGGTAMLVEAAGFEAAYMTGAGVCATFGLPDYGLLSMSEMAEQVGRITSALSVPLIADADTGYGNELNVTRTVRAYEARGVSALHIEDQTSPKRCGHLTGKEVVTRAEFIAKIRAAVAARRDPDLVIIARSDARAVIDFDEAITRVNLAIAAGADVAFVEAAQSVEEVAEIPRRVQGPCLLNMVMGGRTPVYDLAAVERMGYAMVIAPALVPATMVGHVIRALAEFKQTGVHPTVPGDMTPAALFAHFGSEKWDALRLAFQESFKPMERVAGVADVVRRVG